jgi:hypothetical protein
MILAKPVIADRYWILKKDNHKVGEIEASDNGYTVKIQNTVKRYTTIKMLGRDADIKFETVATVSVPADNQAYGYNTGTQVFNVLWDVKHKLPLFTKEDNSKSWFAAGWYRVKQHRNWKTIQNPKLITLQRYAYQGPFHSKEEANDKSVS